MKITVTERKEVNHKALQRSVTITVDPSDQPPAGLDINQIARDIQTRLQDSPFTKPNQSK